jgi:indolepyruvate ferredoxin oxidoreductase alpha subunit
MSKLNQPAGSRALLMGNEAIARGAIEAGLQLMAAYPGTPSSEVGEALIEAHGEGDYYVEWSTNEKIAFEVAAGAAQVGARSITAMKNAGLNVAMDTYMTLPYGGVKGGMVIVVADDPDAHYSSTEQDTRLLAAYAEIPCYEPMDQQEAKDMTRDAFELSEALELPVFVRSVSRISHASGDVTFAPARGKRNSLGFNKHYKLPYRWNVYGAPGPVSKHRWLHGVLPKAREAANSSPYNRLELVKGAEVGVLSCGVAASYTLEALERLGLGGKVSFLKLGMIHPLPDRLVSQLLADITTLIVIEEGDPVLENMVRAFAQEKAYRLKIRGKSYDSILPPYGEINADKTSEAIAGVMQLSVGQDKREGRREELRSLVAPRSSTLCAGCSHLGSYWALREALKKHKGVHIINGDIGCYEQGGYGLFASKINVSDEQSKRHPIRSAYEILDTIYVMGSGIGMAQGQAQAGYRDGKVVAVAGDSTFIHATLPAVVNAVYSRADITFLVLDNRWTAMTGHQVNPNTGVDTLGNETEGFDIPAVSKALGVKMVRAVEAYQLEESKQAIAEALEFKGPSVVVLHGECMLQVLRRTGRGAAASQVAATRVDEQACTGCTLCVQLGCPAVMFDKEKKKAKIDQINCVDCNLCVQVCPHEAIAVEGAEA